jgi:hypothetical protein
VAHGLSAIGAEIRAVVNLTQQAPSRSIVPLGVRHLLSVVRGAMSDPRRSVRHELAIREDFAEFERAARQVIRPLPKAEPAGVSLVVSLSGMIYSVKLEGMLGKALELAGHPPIVLTYRQSYWTRRYFGAYGLNRFVFLDDFPIDESEIETSRRAADAWFAGPFSFSTVKGWTFEGAPVGQYAVSTVARKLHRGMPDLTQRTVREELYRQLLKSIQGFLRARRVLNTLSPAVCLFNEINYADYGPIYYAAFERHLNIVQFVHALRDRALVLKRSATETYRSHPNSISLRTLQELEDAPWTEAHQQALEQEFSDRYSGKWFLTRRDQKGTRMKSRDELMAQLALDPQRKTAVVFSHVLWDANLFYGTDLFEDNEHWFVETVRAACANPSVNWVVKLHPANRRQLEWDGYKDELNEVAAIRASIGDLPAHVRLVLPDSDINTYSILELADYGVTVRGTVGMELPCLGIPVLTAGTGRYSGLGFTIDSRTREEYLARIATIQDLPPLDAKTRERAKRHAFAVFCLRPWIMESFENFFPEDIAGFHPLNPSLRIKALTPGQVLQNGDLGKFARWALNQSKFDYLEPWPER